MTARPESCLAGEVSARERTDYSEVSGILENGFLVGSNFLSFSWKEQRWREALGKCWLLPAFSSACRKQMSSGPFFFLLLTVEDFARGSSCWVHSGKQNREKNAKNQKYQKQETKKWLKLVSSEAGMDSSPTEAAEGTPQVRSPTCPETFTVAVGPPVPLESSGRDLRPIEEVELPWKGQAAGGRRVAAVSPPAAGAPAPSTPVCPLGNPTSPANKCT